MSIDIFVYSPLTHPVAVHDLAIAARAGNWEVRVLRDWHDWHDYRVVTEGDLLNGDDLCGWPSKDVLSATVAEVLENHHSRVIEKLFLRDALGYCSFFIASPDDSNAGFSEAEREAIRRDEGESDYHPRFLDGVFEPKLVYTLNTKPGPGRVYGDFFANAGRWLAQICHGAWYDPQDDVHELCVPNNR